MNFSTLIKEILLFANLYINFAQFAY